MDWKLLLSTFGAIFLAELGDKTQIAAFALAGQGSSRLMVFIGASLALVATTAIAVVAGGLLGKYVSPAWIRRGAGILFVAMGIVFLLVPAQPKSDPPSGGDDGATAASAPAP